MLKFKVSPERCELACNTLEYIALSNNNKDIAIRVLPRFLLKDDGEYMVKVNLDDDGDIASFEGQNEALLKMTVVNPKRLEKLSIELCEAIRQIVNPPKGRDSNGRTSTDSREPLPGS